MVTTARGPTTFGDGGLGRSLHRQPRPGAGYNNRLGCASRRCVPRRKPALGERFDIARSTNALNSTTGPSAGRPWRPASTRWIATQKGGGSPSRLQRHSPRFRAAGRGVRADRFHDRPAPPSSRSSPSRPAGRRGAVDGRRAGTARWACRTGTCALVLRALAAVLLRRGCGPARWSNGHRTGLIDGVANAANGCAPLPRRAIGALPAWVAQRSAWRQLAIPGQLVARRRVPR